MMINEMVSSQAAFNSLDDELVLLACLRKIGKGLLATGVSVGVVENTLIEIAQVYQKSCEVIALPNILIVKLGQDTHTKIDFTVQQLTSLRLDQISDFVDLVDEVKQKKVDLDEAIKMIDAIFIKSPRFRSLIIILGYLISCIGLTMLFRPEPRALLVTGISGILVGSMVVWFQKWPRFNLLLPVLAAFVVSLLVFNLTRLGFIYGSANLLITSLITFLPGALLTTGMIELASMQIISGSARLIYGTAVLLLLFFGISAGFNVSGLPGYQVYAYEVVIFPWWAPILGTTLFGVGTFIRLNGANRDLAWMLLVLYLAMICQTFGERYFNAYIGAFLAATMMAISSEVIARSPKRTPAVVSQTLAFWFLVPGARGLLSITSLLSDNMQGAAIGLGQVIILIISISLGVLLGTLVVSPQKFVILPTKYPR